MRRRGITLIELLLALTIASLVMMVAGGAMTFGSRTVQTLGRGRDAVARRVAFENDLADLFSHAFVDPDSSNTSTFFVCGASSGEIGGEASSTDNNSVTFTVLGRRLPSALVASEDDFEANNDKYGAAGGTTEIGLSTSAVGTDAADRAGLFLREQTPSDGDPTQGGLESVLSPDVDTISFEFYDGTDWQTSWDTTTMSVRRIPSAVRVTYKFTDEETERVLVFPVPTSDVTPDNPVELEAAG